MNVKPEWKQGLNCAEHVGINHGLIFILKVEVLKQVVRVEFDLVYGRKNC